ncbi:jumonji superfamily protein [Mycena belliarum]|uniref:[histone H3]-trimethyl-L-lysine(9) demethylase n=1 Tax=Mycena belliarum TaxID=1033014 RepID=A0AAD6TU76_9AGAR|nr:jumonji superfamily protein [Mycena belliae]
MSSPVSSLTASRSPSPEPPVQPDHFYGADPSHLPPSPDSEGKTYLSPDDDPLAHRGIPVFKPTMHEFADFEGYMTRVECWGRRSGIVKVVPPKEWTDALPDVKPQLANVKIKSPIEQFMRGRAGLFRQENMEKRKLMSVREWVELCAKDEFRAPGVDQVGVHNNPSALPPLRSRRKKTAGKVADPDINDIKPHPTDDGPDVTMASPPNSASPDPEDAKPDDSKPRNRRVERADKDSLFLETFNPHTDWLPPSTRAVDYTPEFCAKLERAFWRNCGLGKPAWYGADTMGSLYTSVTTAWNVAHLHSTLSRLLPASSQGLPGVNTPYLYFGMWRATFAWHVEDMDLFSINYIHFGAPKFWYAIPQARAGALEDTMRGYFPQDTSTCPQFLRHKSFLASPTLLAQSAVRPNHLVQHAGEFVITYPRGYHAGFNLGLNCAESVNFALDSWLEEGRKASVCKCVDDSVRIDVDQLLEDRRIEALEKTDPVAAALARAVRDGENVEDIFPVESKPEALPTVIIPPAKPRSPRKRKPTTPFEPAGAAKRPRTISAPSTSTSAPPLASTSAAAAPAQRLTLKLGPRPEEETFPCCLCVDPSTDGLARVHDLPPAWRDLGPATRMHFIGGRAVWMAHEACAFVLPETWVDEIAGERIVFGVDGIVRARWALKCSSCIRARSKAHGALIQCAKGKCPKSFHVNCAKTGGAAGIAYSIVREVEKEVVLLEPAPPSSSSDPVPEPNLRVLKVIKKIEAEALCAQHNPLIVASRRASKQESLRADVLALPPLSRIKLRVSAGVFEVTLMRVVEERRSVEVLWDLGEVREFKWGSIILGATTLPTVKFPGKSTGASAPYHATIAPTHAHDQYPSSGPAQQHTSFGPAHDRTSSTIPKNDTRHTADCNSMQSTASASALDTHQPPPTSARSHNPYNVFKYEYWPYGYGPGGQTANLGANVHASASGANQPTNSAAGAASHTQGSHYVNQYYAGPDAWSSPYYRSGQAYFPQAQGQQGPQAAIQTPYSMSYPSAPAANSRPVTAPNQYLHSPTNSAPAQTHTPPQTSNPVSAPAATSGPSFPTPPAPTADGMAVNIAD